MTNPLNAYTAYRCPKCGIALKKEDSVWTALEIGYCTECDSDFLLDEDGENVLEHIETVSIAELRVEIEKCRRRPCVAYPDWEGGYKGALDKILAMLPEEKRYG